MPKEKIRNCQNFGQQSQQPKTQPSQKYHIALLPTFISQIPIKIFVGIRNLIFPYKIIGDFLSNNAVVLDVGCGHGTLAGYLAQEEPKRQVLGIDPDTYKIDYAQKQYHLSNLEFKVATLESQTGKYTTITVCDVFYLLNDRDKERCLKKIKRVLKHGGLLIIKETNPNLFVELEETFMKHIGLTFSNQKRLYFKPPQYYQQLVTHTGFTILKAITLSRFFIYQHFILVCENN